MARFHFWFLSVLVYKVHSICQNTRIDLNTATLSELDSLPYISAVTAQSIIDIRPICSPQELISSPKQIYGLTEERLSTHWNWNVDKACSDTCCLADASCDELNPASLSSDSTYYWSTSLWSDCSVECETGLQYRTVRCIASDSTKFVSNAICALNEAQPLSKQLCNTHKCSVYDWIGNEWNSCELHDAKCVQSREVYCYDRAYNKREADTKCDLSSKLPGTQSCEMAKCVRARAHSHKIRASPRIASKIDVASIDLLAAYNHGRCYTDSYYGGDESTLITRRACTVDIEVYFSGDTSSANVDKSWFYLDATLDATQDETVGDLFTNQYLSYSLTDSSTAHLTISIPSNGFIGKFSCKLYFQRDGDTSGRKEVQSFTLYVLFNPYSSEDDTYVTSRTDRMEYIENTDGLIWFGSATQNTARTWDYDHFNVQNLDIAMHLLRRLSLQYRNETVLIARQISYAVADDICYGRWSEPYTTGHPYGGYQCGSKTECVEPWIWTGTTQMFDIYRDELNYKYSVQYCQCWVFAGVTTTVGRSLGIATRPVTNFQSAHDTDFNRAIEKFFRWNSWSKTFSEASGDSSDSVWNFHVWNDMYFKRSDFIDTAHNTDGWQAVDATPQEASFGGNPALTDDDDDAAAYQMGPASLAMIKDNSNPSDCKYAAAHRARWGCFDQEFVISEVNAYYNLWYTTSRLGSEYTLYDNFKYNPFNSESTIGQQISTKTPGSVSDNCMNQAIRDCSDDLLDVTLQYKDVEPSGADAPTNDTNYYVGGDTRTVKRRRLVDNVDFNGIDHTVDLIPNEWYPSSMLIADEKEDILKLYGDDYTFGEMSINVDSYYDEARFIYCGFTVTAHDYRGDLINNKTVKMDKMDFVLQPGKHSRCSFDLNYTEYESWITNAEEVPHMFKFIMSVTVSEQELESIDTLLPSMLVEPIVEERDVLICAPKYKLSDRIMCHNGLIWDQPSHNLTYDCKASNGIHIESVADGICDAVNNVDPCYDGGDCCATSCVPSDACSSDDCCTLFNCSDARVSFQNKHYYECTQALSFIDYMNGLYADSICINLDKSIIAPDLQCSQDIWKGDTESECFNQVNAARDVYGDVKTCLTQTLNSMEDDMAQIIGWAIDCWVETHPNESVTTLNPQTSNNKESTTSNGADKSEKEKKSDTVNVVLVVLSVIFVVAFSGVLYYIFTKNKGQAGGSTDKTTPFVQLPEHEDNL